MDALIAAFFSKTENIALLFSFSANVALAWFVVFLMREGKGERVEERKAKAESMKNFADTLDTLRSAVIELTTLVKAKL